MENYSLKKGLMKGAVSVVVFAIALVTFAGMSDLTIWSLLEQYVKPVVGSLTVAGLLTVLLNWLKMRSKA